MTLRALRDRLLLQEDLNFLLTNRVPRRALTLLMGWFSRIENRLLCRLSIAVWRLFTDLDLSEAEQRSFPSLHACFTRRLKPGARPVDGRRGVLVSPCDAIVGACGPIAGTEVFQAKGFPYALPELLGSRMEGEPFRDGQFVTLRLTSAMYHRFHAPADGRVTHLRYLSGDTWNVNPIALKRVERLFCRNERAVLRMQLGEGGWPVLLVPVAAILVASIRLNFIDVRFHLRYRGAHDIACDAPVKRGEELGWFEHGSTIIALLPAGFRLADGIETGQRIRMGQALAWAPDAVAQDINSQAQEAST
ncbi:MAG: phosphatidylserine decarboxylase [Rhodocyclaceae bacterium]|nr:phosphatidylserine decarboxylase [Rhodocyclaceae bacterium]